MEIRTRNQSGEQEKWAEGGKLGKRDGTKKKMGWGWMGGTEGTNEKQTDPTNKKPEKLKVDRRKDRDTEENRQTEKRSRWMQTDHCADRSFDTALCNMSVCECECVCL